MPGEGGAPDSGCPGKAVPGTGGDRDDEWLRLGVPRLGVSGGAQAGGVRDRGCSGRWVPLAAHPGLG